MQRGRRRLQLGVLVAVIGSLSVIGVAVAGGGGDRDVRERLNGYEEVPSVSSTGVGEFKGEINRAGTELAYELSYAALEGDVQQAHIHLGQTGVNGGITMFLCTNLGNGPAGTQACPPPPAKITGTLKAADVVPNAQAVGQGIAPGEFAEVLAAMRAGVTYVNVHSSRNPGGEIRAQIEGGRGRGHDD